MNKKTGLLLLFFLLLPMVFAGDINLSLNQKDYFFRIGENAVINLHSENTYNETINGILSYTITQSINQGNFQYSSYNTKSTSFSVEKGENSTPLNFGTSETPSTFLVTLKFSYDKNEAREVVLEDIKIHFVDDESKKNSQESSVSGSSQKAQPTQQQDPFAEQEQRIQQILNQVNQNQEPQQQSTKQKVQNNQLSQDSSALKKQLQQQAAEQQKTQEELLEKISQDSKFQEFDQQLQQQDFNQQGSEFSQDGNKTTVQINYKNNANQEAQIKAEIDQNKVQKIELIQENQNKEKNNWWLPLIALLFLAALGYFAHKKFLQKKTKKVVEEKTVEKTIDYKAQSLLMLEQAKKLFEEKEYKEAYGKAGQAIRLYLSHENGLKKEVTNDELTEWLRRHNKKYKGIKECFDLCSLVEFAKYKANKKDFDKIIKAAKKIFRLVS